MSPGANSGVVLSSDLTFITNEHGQHLGDRFGILLGDDTRFYIMTFHESWKKSSNVSEQTKSAQWVCRSWQQAVADNFHDFDGSNPSPATILYCNAMVTMLSHRPINGLQIK